MDREGRLLASLRRPASAVNDRCAVVDVDVLTTKPKTVVDVDVNAREATQKRKTNNLCILID